MQKCGPVACHDNVSISNYLICTKGAVKVRRVADEKCDTWLRFRTTP
jgi:hypothetical protein